jgi:hypothetical protein
MNGPATGEWLRAVQAREMMPLSSTRGRKDVR